MATSVAAGEGTLQERQDMASEAHGFVPRSWYLPTIIHRETSSFGGPFLDGKSMLCNGSSWVIMLKYDYWLITVVNIG